jgi:hypothetical protein
MYDACFCIGNKGLASIHDSLLTLEKHVVRRTKRLFRARILVFTPSICRVYSYPKPDDDLRETLFLNDFQ